MNVVSFMYLSAQYILAYHVIFEICNYQSWAWDWLIGYLFRSHDIVFLILIDGVLNKTETLKYRLEGAL